MKVLDRSLFAAIGTGSSATRTKRLSSSEVLAVGDDFFQFGKSYFDGGTNSAAYQKYIYDGRYSEAVSKIITKFNMRKDSTIFEFGCAKGFILYEFYRAGFRNLKGVDISKYAIENSPFEIKPFIEVADSDWLELQSNKYDFIYSKEVLPHLDDHGLRRFFGGVSKSIDDAGIIYFEIQVPSDNKQAGLIRKFDPTHRTLWNAESWVDYLSNQPFSKSLYLYFKVLF